MITEFEAVISLVPNAKFGMKDGVIIGWENTEVTQPTKEEIQTEINRLQVIYDSEEYKRKRQLEYGTVSKQIEFITEKGLEAWKTNVQAIKTKYPKE